MLWFENDYSDGAHEFVLERLVQTNREKLSGYGNDKYSLAAAEKLRALCGRPKADIFFLSGGTQTNKTVIGSLLGSCEGVVCASSGHINVHEAGAVEATGHKVMALPHFAGKLESDTLRDFFDTFFTNETREHMVWPGMVYISQPTEYGTVYTRSELAELYDICRGRGIPLYIDGARLAYALACSQNDAGLSDIAECSDVFYIGGTKCGALCGEAVVFPRGDAPVHFISAVKQHGALLAKGRLLGVQFDALFTGGLYLELARRALDAADALREALSVKGCEFYIDSPTNQIFIVLDNERAERLAENVHFSVWERPDELHTVVRFVVNHTTSGEDIEALAGLL